MISVKANGKNAAYGTKFYIADEPQDKDKLNLQYETPGSTVFVIATSETFMLNSNHQWIKITIPTTGSGSGGGDNPDGSYDGGSIPEPPVP